MKVLVVEDDAMAARFLQASLEKREHEVVHCRDAESAWRYFEKHPFPLAFLDLSLPGMSGLELCRLIRGHRNGGRTVIVTVTAGTTEITLMDMLDAGADDFLLKSALDPKVLASRIAIAESWVRDREARRSAETELRASRESFHNVVEQLGDAIVVATPKGQVQYSNPAARRLFNLNEAEMTGCHLDIPLVPGQACELRLRPSGVDRDHIYEMTTVNTEWRGQPAMMASLRDVSRLLELQDELRHSEIMGAMGSLVGGVAHEVRNPLFSISATVDALYALFVNDDGFERFDPFLKNLQNESHRLSVLMRDLLEYGRPSTQKKDPHPIADIVTDAVSRCGERARLAGVELVRTDDIEGAVVFAEREQIAKVVENLVANAIAFSPEGDAVALRLFGSRNDRDRLVGCSVTDRGPGIEADDLDEIFKPFFSKRKDGTGLGLALAQKIANEHGGVIEARSEPGAGAQLTMFLPRYDSEQDAGDSG